MGRFLAVMDRVFELPAIEPQSFPDAVIVRRNVLVLGHMVEGDRHLPLHFAYQTDRSSGAITAVISLGRGRGYAALSPVKEVYSRFHRR